MCTFPSSFIWPAYKKRDFTFYLPGDLPYTHKSSAATEHLRAGNFTVRNEMIYQSLEANLLFVFICLCNQRRPPATAFRGYLMDVFENMYRLHNFEKVRQDVYMKYAWKSKFSSMNSILVLWIISKETWAIFVSSWYVAVAKLNLSKSVFRWCSLLHYNKLTSVCENM